MSSIFSNSKAFASELLENIEDMFSQWFLSPECFSSLEIKVSLINKNMFFGSNAHVCVLNYIRGKILNLCRRVTQHRVIKDSNLH